MAQVEHFRTESSKLQRQLHATAEATYERREAELYSYIVQEIDELQDEVAIRPKTNFRWPLQ